MLFAFHFRSGKTRLVESVCDFAVSANNVLVVKKKFEQNSTNQLSLVLSAFNDMCILLANENQFNTERSGYLWHKLASEFATNLHMLVSILPNVIKLVPSPEIALSLANGINSEGEVNFFSLCDMIKRFMRAVSNPSRPSILFLDDLQWADSVSLGLVNTIVSDKKGASGVFFVGSYRDNEVSEGHILHGLCSWLSSFQVPLSKCHLNGLSESEVNAMVSESLGMLPRSCHSLSQVVFRKTEGNPLFMQTFLQSLGMFELVLFMYY